MQKDVFYSIRGENSGQSLDLSDGNSFLMALPGRETPGRTRTSKCIVWLKTFSTLKFPGQMYKIAVGLLTVQLPASEKMRPFKGLIELCSYTYGRRGVERTPTGGREVYLCFVVWMFYVVIAGMESGPSGNLGCYVGHCRCCPRTCRSRVAREVGECVYVVGLSCVGEVL